jgi:hypothetical protein
MSTAESKSDGASTRTKRVPILIAALVLLGLGGWALKSRASHWGPRAGATSTSGRPAAPVPASAPVLAFLAPLAEGSSIGGAEVVHISGVEDGLIHIDLRKNGQVLHFAIGLVHSGYNAPRAGQYAVYIWERTPNAASSPLAEAIAASLRSHPSRPPPPGLTEGSFNAPPH